MKRLQYIVSILVVQVRFIYFDDQLSKSQGYYIKRNTLNLYNWGDYIIPDLITNLKKKRIIVYRMKTFEGLRIRCITKNEQGNAYDLAVRVNT